MLRPECHDRVRWADTQFDRLPAYGCRSCPTTGGRDRRDRRGNPALAAKAATTTIPIVIRDRSRSGEIWPCREPEPTGRQRHRRAPAMTFELAAKRLTAARVVPRGRWLCSCNPSSPKRSTSRETCRRRQALAQPLTSSMSAASANFETAFCSLAMRVGGADRRSDWIL